MWFGCVQSSLQAEGVAPAADWSAWERDRLVPSSSDGSGFALDYRDELALLADHGLRHLRIGLEWARIEPEPDRIDSNAIDQYLDILRAGNELGIEMWATLHHQTLPGWFSEDGHGFAEPYHWLRQVDRCAELFGGLISGWVPIDDPIGWAIRSRLLGSRPPGRRDEEQTLDAIRDALAASFGAWELLRAGDAPVMAVFNVPTIFPADPRSGPKARWFQQLFWDSWIGLLGEGELVLPDHTYLRHEEQIEAYDLIGLRFDAPIAIDHEGRLSPYPHDARRDDTGLAPWPEELGRMLHQIAERLPERSLVVAGNGIATEDDDWRDEVLKESLRQVHLAAADGIDIRGYEYDTTVDAYEGRMGFAAKRGLFTRDRTPKPSIEAFKELL